MIAKSRELFVKDNEPWWNCCATIVVLTPSPFFVLPELNTDDAYTSANSARDSLKPVVLTLAMLFAVTSKSFCAAAKPVNAILKLITHL